MTKFKYEIKAGDVFGDLIVLDVENFERVANHIKYLCKCTVCAKQVMILRNNLIKGNSKRCRECGILSTVGKNTKYSDTLRVMKNAYRTMLARCYNNKHVQFSDYGGRGIEVCDRWRESFENFLEDMGERPEGLSLDRINNDEGYCPENCRWATRKEQAANTRNRKSFSGEKYVIYQKDTGKFRVVVTLNGKRVSLGYFDSIEKAVKERDIFMMQKEIV